MRIAYLAPALAGVCFAQSSTQFQTAGPMLGGPFEARITMGQPFTADVVVETNQTLPDGSHVVNRQTVTAARDSQGRTRREEVPTAPPGAGQQQKIVFISDPVAQVTYVLGPDHVARKLPLVSPEALSGAVSMSDAVRLSTSRPPSGSQQLQRFSTSGGGAHSEPPGSKTDPLGTQIISGEKADGSRITFVIPAGHVGNQNSLAITDERWYSQDLQATVLARHADPRFGELSYQLTNIQRSEPPSSAFQIPSDYSVEGAGK